MAAAVKFLLALLFGVPLAMGVAAGVAVGNPFAIGIALGVLGPAAFFVSATALGALMRSAPAPRKADPAKIARLERELEVGPAWEAHRQHEAERGYLQGQADAAGPEAPTTIDRPWPCVIDNQFASDCEGPHYETGGGTRRLCLRRYRAETFHGAPTFGHKIEGP